MHKLDLDTTSPPTSSPTNANPVQTSATAPGQPPVDGTASSGHNGPSDMNKKVMIALGVVAVLAGIGTGYGGYQLRAQSSGGTTTTAGSGNIERVAEGAIKKGDVFGVEDESTFKDTAEGYLEAGGLDGEGSHKLLRPGGVSQTVYLTSSVTDLDDFVGMEVKIAGETFQGQKAGWLMDVGRVEVVKVAGEAPVEN